MKGVKINEGIISGHQEAKVCWRKFFHCSFIFYSKQCSVIFKYYPPLFQPSENESSGFVFVCCCCCCVLLLSLFAFPNDLDSSLYRRKDTQGFLYGMIPSKRQWRPKLFVDIILNLNPFPHLRLSQWAGLALFVILTGKKSWCGLDSNFSPKFQRNVTCGSMRNLSPEKDAVNLGLICFLCFFLTK